MSRYLLEGESFFVLKKLEEITKNKQVSFQQESFSNSLSFIHKADFYVFFDMNKELAEKIINLPFVVCNVDKNYDLRADWVKSLKNCSEYYCFDPIPSTDFQTLKKTFPDIEFTHFLPVKKTPLKYKNIKQNYEWYDLDLINNLLPFQDEKIFEEFCGSYFDIWQFTDALWSGNEKALKYISLITYSNFEEYFNRIRETIKDYIEVYQTNSNNLRQHTALIKNSIVINEFRFQKVKEKLNNIDQNKIAFILSLYDECLKNVREGANPKLELLGMFFKFKANVIR